MNCILLLARDGGAGKIHYAWRSRKDSFALVSTLIVLCLPLVSRLDSYSSAENTGPPTFIHQ